MNALNKDKRSFTAVILHASKEQVQCTIDLQVIFCPSDDTMSPFSTKSHLLILEDIRCGKCLTMQTVFSSVEDRLLRFTAFRN